MRIVAHINGDKGTITMYPSWIARLFGARVRRGDIVRKEAFAQPGGGARQHYFWCWAATCRPVSDEVEHAIEQPEVAKMPTAQARSRC